jgi:hypothetical protein
VGANFFVSGQAVPKHQLFAPVMHSGTTSPGTRSAKPAAGTRRSHDTRSDPVDATIAFEIALPFG